MKCLKEEIADNDEVLNIVNEIGEEYRTKEDFRNVFSDEIEKLEEALNNYLSENGISILKTDFPDEWKYLKENVDYPYENFKSNNDFQKPVINLKKKTSLEN